MNFFLGLVPFLGMAICVALWLSVFPWLEKQALKLDVKKRIKQERHSLFEEWSRSVRIHMSPQTLCKGTPMTKEETISAQVQAIQAGEQSVLEAALGAAYDEGAASVQTGGLTQADLDAAVAAKAAIDLAAVKEAEDKISPPPAA